MATDIPAESRRTGYFLFFFFFSFQLPCHLPTTGWLAGWLRPTGGGVLVPLVYCCNDRQMGCRAIWLSRREICPVQTPPPHFNPLLVSTYAAGLISFSALATAHRSTCHVSVFFRLTLFALYNCAVRVSPTTTRTDIWSCPLNLEHVESSFIYTSSNRRKNSARHRTRQI
jgi:hypothetical protein